MFYVVEHILRGGVKVINEYGYARASQSCGEKFCQGGGYGKVRPVHKLV